jgi:predicted CXXCH cytochrome family protein
MHRYLTMISILAFIAGSSTVLADTFKSKGPELMYFNMRVLMPFQHWKHQTLANDECLHCHDRNSKKIKGWGKEVAHKICIPCHDLDQKGPVLCHECHGEKILSHNK